MPRRRGSKYGDSEEKQKARLAVHAILSAEAAPTSKLLLLAGSYRHEVDIAIDYGWDLRNILHVDWNPQYMSNFVRRFHGEDREIVLANRYNDKLSNVCRTLAALGVKLNAIHADFCDPIETTGSDKPRFEIEKMLMSGIIEKGLVAITVQNGRVPLWAVPAFQNPNLTVAERTALRVEMITNAFWRVAKTTAVTLVGKGTYTNEQSNTPMIWTVFKLG